MKNFRNLQRVVPDPPEETQYKKIYYFILEFIRKTTDSPERACVPTWDYIHNHFDTEEGSASILILLEQIKSEQIYIGADYIQIINDYNDQCRELEFSRLLNNANKIASCGMEINEGNRKIKLKGIPDAFSHITSGTIPLIYGQGHGNIALYTSYQSHERRLDAYKQAMTNPLEAIGIKTFCPCFDQYGGLRKGQMFVVGAFSGHYKTTYSLNISYQASLMGFHGLYVTTEMCQDEILDQFVLKASDNRQYAAFLPKFADCINSISINSLQNGEINDRQLEYLSLIKEDICSTDRGYGEILIADSTKIKTLSDIITEATVFDSQLRARGKELDYIVIDYLTQLGIEPKHDKRNEVTNKNELFRRVKFLSTEFAGGKGLSLIVPHQINRHSYNEVVKNGGTYNPTCLSDYHEAERSADGAIAIYRSPEGEGTITILKSRRIPEISTTKFSLSRGQLMHVIEYDTCQQSDEQQDLGDLI